MNKLENPEKFTMYHRNEREKKKTEQYTRLYLVYSQLTSQTYTQHGKHY